jgi:hypothetical protein
VAMGLSLPWSAKAVMGRGRSLLPDAPSAGETVMQSGQGGGLRCDTPDGIATSYGGGRQPFKGIEMLSAARHPYGAGRARADERHVTAVNNGDGGESDRVLPCFGEPVTGRGTARS